MTKQQLKKMYDGKKIGEIEAEARKNHGLSTEAQGRMIEALSYLRMSGRHKENPKHKNSSFWSYLMDQFNMREKTFREMERAFTYFPEETKLYSVGMVAKVRRNCGAKKEKAVFAEIAKAQGKLKTPIKREKIKAIIQANSPVEKKKDPVIDWRGRYVAEVEAHSETKNQLSAAREQIEKLKKTVLELRPLRDMRDAIKPFMVQEQTEHRVQ